MPKRSYEMGNRVLQAQLNTNAIYDACIALWQNLPLSEITLDKVAHEAQVTVRTVIRKFGSKEGLLEACVKREAERIIAARDAATADDLEQALVILLEHYEAEGDFILRALAAESTFAIAQELVTAGHDYHKAWCARIFHDVLPAATSKSYKVELAAYIAATDIYLWRLLRRDQKLTRQATQSVMLRLIQALKNTSNREGETYVRN